MMLASMLKLEVLVQRSGCFFDVKVFYPNASSYRSVSLTSAYKHHEDAKKWEYGHRVREVENGIFTPLAFHWWHGLGGHCFL